VNEIDLALQPEIRVLEPAFGVRRIDGAVVILGEKVLSPATVRRAQAITFRRVCIEEFDDGLEADAVLGESDFPVDAPEERVDFVENDCRDLIECVCRDGVRMGDVELREIVEQVSFPEVVLVRVVDESTEEVIAR